MLDNKFYNGPRLPVYISTVGDMNPDSEPPTRGEEPSRRPLPDSSRDRSGNSMAAASGEPVVSPVTRSSVDDKPVPACKHCRARKVKCDRVEPSCGPCVRLKFNCSYSYQLADSTPGLDDHDPDRTTMPGTPSERLTQAGTRRARTRQACEACRAVKAKCSGGWPCMRCVSRVLSCGYLSEQHNRKDARSMHRRRQLSTSPVRIASENSSHSPRTLSSPQHCDNSTPPNQTPTSSFGATGSGFPTALATPIPPLSLTDETVVKRSFDAYFDNHTSAPNPVFLHKSRIISDWRRGFLDRNLTKALVANGLLISDDKPEVLSATRTWIQEAQEAALADMRNFTVTRVQVLLLAISFRFRSGDAAQVWTLLALAARLVFTMRLNHESDSDIANHVELESRRRLVWGIYVFDSIFAGGAYELRVCPSEMVHIRLPCDDVCFRRGSPSKAGSLVNDMDGDIEHAVEAMDVSAHFMRLLRIRDRVLTYTNGLKRRPISPQYSRYELNSLTESLGSFELGLPEGLKMTHTNLELMAHSSEASGYLILHTTRLQCHCDLYGLLIPGLRGTVSQEAMDSTPPAFRRECQHACLRYAADLCSLWSELRDLEPSQIVGDMLFVISVYQVAQVLYHLKHLLPGEGMYCAAEQTAKLGRALELAAPLKRLYAGAEAYLLETAKLLRVLRGEVEELLELNGSGATENATGGEGPHEDAVRGCPGLPEDLKCWPKDSQSAYALPGDRSFRFDLFDFRLNDYYDPDLGDFLISVEPAADLHNT